MVALVMTGPKDMGSSSVIVTVEDAASMRCFESADIRPSAKRSIFGSEHVSDELTEDQIAYLHERAERRRGIWRGYERRLKDQVRELKQMLERLHSDEVGEMGVIRFTGYNPANDRSGSGSGSGNGSGDGYGYGYGDG